MTHFFVMMSVLVLFGAYYDYAYGLYDAWQREEYSHGILIPLISILMGLNRLKHSNPIPQESSWGLMIILSGYLLMGVAGLSAFEPPAHYGFILGLSGIFLSFYGYSVFKTLFPALLFLLFAIPLPRLIEVGLTSNLQLISSTLGVALLQSLGVSVFQEGNIIDMGTHKIQVVEACSGLRFLFPLMSLSFLVAYLFQGPLWKRLVLFVSAIPITIVMNSLRIAVTGLLVDGWGPHMAEGLVHDAEGWVIFILCIFILFIEATFLSKIGKVKGHLQLENLGLPHGSFFAQTPKLGAIGGIAITLCLLLTVIISFANIKEREDIIPTKKSFLTFPLTLGSWKGQQTPMDPLVLESLKLTDYWNADYQRTLDESPVNLYIAYYQTQKLGATAHSPSNCLPGSGWEILEKQTVVLDLHYFSLPVTRMVIQKGEAKLLIYYWFDQRGRLITEQYGAKWYLFWDSLLSRRSDGAVIRLMTPLQDKEKLETTDERLRTFIQESFEAIDSFTPD